MPTITGTSILDRAEVLLQDVTNVRWPRTELLGYLNDGQRETVLLKPEACVTNAAVLLTAGATKQTLPAAGLQFLKLTRNMGAAGTTPGNAIRVVDGEVLDAQVPSWHVDANAGGDIKHYSYDPRDPKTYYVYPKAPATAWYVEIVYSSAPTDANDSGGVIGIDDVYANALLDYVLYRAYSKDATYASNGQRAIAHYQAFANSLGVKTANEQVRNPNVIGQPANPNIPVKG